ncbi:DUF4157 domain-containing protein [Undibacterium sp. Ji49W]|uniref:eCIS core domain-containing protein n=1 Tax=Undibacterium sp. Ji49W TaxID=3413040 RepID=UPI003BF1A12C
MQTHTSQDAASKTLSAKTTGGKTQGLTSNENASQTTDQRPEAGAMRQLQGQANRSPRALQLQSLQKMAGQSPQASRLNSLQVMADGRAAQRMQHQPPALQRQTAAAADNSPIASSVRPTKNNGLPAQLQAGVESLSGMSLDHVQVHYNSSKPAQLQAHAYAQGSDIHLAPGQEQHLPHEAWHVVQQAQGRVRPTLQMKQGVPVNDDVGLEQEADVMGARAMSVAAASVTAQRQSQETRGVYSPVQRQGVAQLVAVAQLTIKDNILALGKGYSGPEAENLKTIAGSWSTAFPMAEKMEIAFFRKINATHYDRLIKMQILQQLDEANYDHLLDFVGNDAAKLGKLVKKEAGTSLVRRMVGEQALPLRTMVLGMSDNAGLKDIGKLGYICEHYPKFLAITDAEKTRAAPQLQVVITGLGTISAAMLAILETAAPTFDQLKTMVPKLTKTSGMAVILATYPNFRAIAVAQVIDETVKLQKVITWLSDNPGLFGILETANPNFGAFQALMPALTKTTGVPVILATYPNFRAIALAQLTVAPAVLQNVITWLTSNPGLLGILETANPDFVALQGFMAALTKTSGLTDILATYPKFRAIALAQLAGASAQLQTVITWLTDNKGLLGILETADPSFADLQGLMPTMTKTSGLPAILKSYPNFRAIALAQLIGAPALLQKVITWLTGKDAAVLGVLETANPSFVALQAMVPALTNLTSLPNILTKYANFKPIAVAEIVAAPVLLQTVITHLGSRKDPVLTWLHTNNPNFAVLEVLADKKPDDTLLGMMVNFAKEAAPGDNDYEAIGTQSNGYRIGHFAMGHTLRGMLAEPALDTPTKTLWPAATTLAEIRGVCLNFDQNNTTILNAREGFTYTPTVAPNNLIVANKNNIRGNRNKFDQLYPRSGTLITKEQADTLSEINAAKADWTALP